MKYSVIKCKNIYDPGAVILTFTGLFSWFKAMNNMHYFTGMNDGFIYGIKKG